MGRRPQPHIRDALLDRCVDHALSEGLPDRLDPFVVATGTSARMLIYHFGTRDALVKAVLTRARQRQLETWGTLLQVRPEESYLVTLDRAWTSIVGPDGSRYRRLFGLWHDTAARELLPDFARSATTDWLALLRDGFQTIGRPELATLALAVFRGLFVDIDSTADTDRAHHAFRDFLALLELS